MVGVPYPPYYDHKVQSKQKYLDNVCRQVQNKESGNLAGSEWYSTQAIRAMNQAIGRVIRHRDDFGAIYLCDLRFD